MTLLAPASIQDVEQIVSERLGRLAKRIRAEVTDTRREITEAKAKLKTRQDKVMAEVERLQKTVLEPRALDMALKALRAKHGPDATDRQNQITTSLIISVVLEQVAKMIEAELKDGE